MRPGVEAQAFSPTGGLRLTCPRALSPAHGLAGACGLVVAQGLAVAVVPPATGWSVRGSRGLARGPCAWSRPALRSQAALKSQSPLLPGAQGRGAAPPSPQVGGTPREQARKAGWSVGRCIFNAELRSCAGMPCRRAAAGSDQRRQADAPLAAGARQSAGEAAGLVGAVPTCRCLQLQT